MKLDGQTNELYETNRSFARDWHYAVTLLDKKSPNLIEIEMIGLQVSVDQDEFI